MKQEDKELLLKDLCGRLPYGVKVQVCNATEYTPILKGILGDDLFLQFDYITKPIKNGDSTYNLIEDNIKPYLRPMSSMTRDEVEELKSKCIHTETEEDWEGVRCDSWGIEILDKYDTRNRNNQIDAVSYINMEAIDWLNAHHFDYRNFIKRGLALPAPEGMYKF